MQEILFKAKRKDNGEWVEGQYCYVLNAFSKSGEPKKHLICNGTNVFNFEVDPETVCSYTGLNDRNGNRIFDWDKCRFFMENGSCSDSVGVVFWDTAKAGFSVREEESGSVNPFDIFYAENCEIIGNKYDKEG